METPSNRLVPAFALVRTASPRHSDMDMVVVVVFMRNPSHCGWEDKDGCR